MKEFEIDVDYYYGPIETYTIMAKDLKSAKKKARDKYMREYFKKSLIKVTKS